jgi:hypothetical protein
MAMSICPDCGKESKDSAACSECGRAFDGVVIEGESRPLAWVIFVMLIAGLVGTAVVVVQMCRG